MSSTSRAPLMLVPAAAGDSERPGPPELDDSALLAGLKARDTSLSNAFYKRVRPTVDRTLTRLLGTRDKDYEDVAQLALFELVATIDRFRGECPLDAWISIVTAVRPIAQFAVAVSNADFSSTSNPRSSLKPRAVTLHP
jgi:hypothetical protein